MANHDASFRSFKLSVDGIRDSLIHMNGRSRHPAEFMCTHLRHMVTTREVYDPIRFENILGKKKYQMFSTIHSLFIFTREISGYIGRVISV